MISIVSIFPLNANLAEGLEPLCFRPWRNTAKLAKPLDVLIVLLGWGDARLCPNRRFVARERAVMFEDALQERCVFEDLSCAAIVTGRSAHRRLWVLPSQVRLRPGWLAP